MLSPAEYQINWFDTMEVPNCQPISLDLHSSLGKPAPVSLGGIPGTGDSRYRHQSRWAIPRLVC